MILLKIRECMPDGTVKVHNREFETPDQARAWLDAMLAELTDHRDNVLVSLVNFEPEA